MKFYLRRIGSKTIRGPYTKEEIEIQLPDELERATIEAYADRGQSPDVIAESSAWIPVGSLLNQKTAKEPKITYEKERSWISTFAELAIYVMVISAVYGFYQAMKLESGALGWQTLCHLIFGLLIVLGIKYAILMLADISDTLRNRGEGE